MGDKATIAYSQNDFFYASAQNIGKMPTSDVCNSMDIYNSRWDTSCNDINFVDNSGNCINKELCINKINSELIGTVQNKNSGSLEKYENTKQTFNRTMLTTINLGIGVIVLGLAVYINRSATKAVV
jgi:hypothetical protein